MRDDDYPGQFVRRLVTGCPNFLRLACRHARWPMPLGILRGISPEMMNEDDPAKVPGEL